MIDIKHKDVIENDSIEIDGIEFVKVVRCRECKWFAEFTHNGEPTGHGSCNNPQNGWGRCPQADWFCADGERRDNE